MAPKVHDSSWLAQVRQPGPNGRTFPEVLMPSQAELLVAAGNTFIMEDDTNPSLFTPGCGAYAGYNQASSFANMSAVKRYAASQNALAFCYTPTARDVTGADALDIEPGDASPGDAPTAYAKGIRYFYGSASWISQIVAKMSAAGIARSNYKIISAHYIGAHICGPGSCGYPQADATQFTSSYLGRSLDATLCPVGFLKGNVGPTLPPTLHAGASGPDVANLRKRLDFYGAGLAANADGGTDKFGVAVLAAVRAFQLINRLTTDGIVGNITWTLLLSKTARHIPATSPADYRVSVSTWRLIDGSWAVVPGMVGYEVVFTPTKGTKAGQNIPQPAPGSAAVHLQGFTVPPVPGTLTISAVAPNGVQTVIHIQKYT